jgi:hypothetical protein
MKTYTLSFAAACEHKLQDSDRTAKRNGAGLNFDVTFKVWPSRVAMARSIRMQQKRESHQTDWHACVPLRDGEGY